MDPSSERQYLEAVRRSLLALVADILRYSPVQTLKLDIKIVERKEPTR